jgi:hypothetical protein
MTDDLGTDDGGLPLDDAGFVQGDAFVGTLAASGAIVDWKDGSAVTGITAMSVIDMVPPPTVTVTGSMFSIANVQPFSVFGMVVMGAGGYRTTYDPITRIDGDPLTALSASVVSEAYLTQLETAFSLTATAGKGIVIARFVDAMGKPISGIPTSAIAIDNAAPPIAPKVLASDRSPMAGATSTSGSGAVVLYDLAPGQLTLTAMTGAGYTFSTPVATIAADAVTLVDIATTVGTVTPPKNVSFGTSVIPIFTKRGCVNCHSGGGPGKQLGGLMLDGGKPNIYKNLTVDISPNFNTTRVDLTTPAKSLVLTMPGYENPPDQHPIVVFASTGDPDYQTILVWITEGAKNN